MAMEENLGCNKIGNTIYLLYQLIYIFVLFFILAWIKVQLGMSILKKLKNMHLKRIMPLVLVESMVFRRTGRHTI